MKQLKQLSAIIEREDGGYLGFGPELDIPRQGDSIEGRRQNILEAVEWFFDTADPSEIIGRKHSQVFVTRLEVEVG